MPVTARIGARRIDRCPGASGPEPPGRVARTATTGRAGPYPAGPGHRPSGPRPGGGYRPDSRRPPGPPRPAYGPRPDVEPRADYGQPRPYDDRPRRDFDDRPPYRPARDRAPGPRPPFRPGPDAGHDRSFRAPAGRPGLPPPDALAADEELVAGRRPVEEAFVARRPARRLLVVPQRRQALERIVLHATSLRIPIVEVEGGSLTALAGFDGHQGVALVVEPRRFATIDDVLARAAERGEPPFVLVLDSLEDPHNVGSLLRSAEGAGVHGVLFPVRRQAPLTPSAIKASAGAVEHLLMCPVDDLASALVDLHAHGIWVAGADGDAPLTARQTDLRGPIAMVVGSEGQGLGPAVRKRCDLFVRIPLRGADRLAQCGRRRLRPPVRSRRPA